MKVSVTSSVAFSMENPCEFHTYNRGGRLNVTSNGAFAGDRQLLMPMLSFHYFFYNSKLILPLNKLHENRLREGINHMVCVNGGY